MSEEKSILSVSELNNLIKDLFDNFPFFQSLSIKGELSNWKGKNISGHIYFSLKDSTSTIKCVMFKYDALSLKENLKDGDNVIIQGSLSVYPPSGTYQIIVKKISLKGEGEILLEKKLLIEKLNKEGLFNKEFKKEIPNFPNQIGVIVGKNSAASKDIEYNLTRRWPLSKIKFYYSLVQGESASNDLINKLTIADNDNNDILIIARGGGSIEDLSAFDDENLARQIFVLKTPIISAIGHEINKSICDLVADCYASTPTGACEIAVPNKDNLLQDLLNYKSYFQSLFTQYLSTLTNKLDFMSNNKVFSSISYLYENKLSIIENYKKSFLISINNYLNNKEKEFINLKTTILTLNPKNIMEKGYVIIKDENNKIIKKSCDLNKNINNSTIVFAEEEVKVKIIKE